MKRPLFPLALCLALTPSLAQHAEAQERPLTTVELHALAVRQAAEVEADRARVSAFLDQPAVLEVAARADLDLTSVRKAVDGLAPSALAEVVSQVERVESETDLVGGNTIVISTTTLIIALLILILITD